MKKLLPILSLAALALGTSVVGQESIPPMQVGGGQSSTRIINGQTVEVSSSLPVNGLLHRGLDAPDHRCREPRLHGDLFRKRQDSLDRSGSRDDGVARPGGP